MMFGIQLSRPGHDIVREALERGLVINCTHGNVLRLLPPFTLTDGEAEEAAGILDAVLMEVVQR